MRFIEWIASRQLASHQRIKMPEWRLELRIYDTKSGFISILGLSAVDMASCSAYPPSMLIRAVIVLRRCALELNTMLPARTTRTADMSLVHVGLICNPRIEHRSRQFTKSESRKDHNRSCPE